jgi:hypothetical protein
MDIMALQPKSSEMKSLLMQADHASEPSVMELARAWRKSKKSLFLDDFIT